MLQSLDQFNLIVVVASTARSLTCPCQNGGQCSMVGLPICLCSNGFTGIYCETSLGKNFIFGINLHRWWVLVSNGCQQLQCLNGGACHEDSSGSSSPYCICKNGYTGEFCEIGEWIFGMKCEMFVWLGRIFSMSSKWTFYWSI